MSSGLDTVTRRQIRRAFGGEALAALNAHETGLVRHAEALLKLSGEQARMRTELHERRLQVDSLTANFVRICQPLERGFWGRLRWLLRGK